MSTIEDVVRRGLAETALLIPDEERVVVAGETGSPRRRTLVWAATKAAVAIAVLGVVSYLVATQVASPPVPQGPCEILWSQLAGSADPESLARGAGLPTDVYVPADLDGSTMYCTAVTEGAIDGPGTVTGMALIDSAGLEVWVVVGEQGDLLHWGEMLGEIGIENLRATSSGLTNALPRQPEVNFWMKAAEYAARMD